MKTIFTTLLLLALVAPAMAAIPGKSAICAALVTGSGGDSLRGLADLVAVEFHSDTRLQLLERQEIQPVLAEQKLNSTGMTDPASAFAVGKLLSVDLFAVLDAEPAGVGLIVYDARSGVRLDDQVLAEKTADKQAVERRPSPC